MRLFLSTLVFSAIFAFVSCQVIPTLPERVDCVPKYIAVQWNATSYYPNGDGVFFYPNNTIKANTTEIIIARAPSCSNSTFDGNNSIFFRNLNSGVSYRMCLSWQIDTRFGANYTSFGEVYTSVSQFQIQFLLLKYCA